jgi:UDP-N-acetylmuramyl pentapeptide phosphotransferase/UDP-N-acetylglucosamine-1-phosphate transferase
MGDVGSLTLGFFIAVLIIRFNEINLTLDSPYAIYAAPSVTFGILIIPLFDTFRVFVMRIVKGGSPFNPDKSHLHHNLVDLGMSHRMAAATLIAANAFFIALVLILQKFLGLHSLFGMVFILAAVLSSIPSYLLMRKNRKHK